MLSFKQFMKESEMFGIEVYEKLLNSMGYEYSRVSGKRLQIKTSENRVSVLQKIAAAISGSKYESHLSGSSVGGVLTKDGVTILAKPLSGGGSGAGAALTALAESAQCLYCAAAWYGNDFTEKTMRNVARYVDVTESIDKIINDLPSDWQESSIHIGTALKEKFGRKKYSFHRGSTWVERLENRFKLLNRKEKEFKNVNKWSPADIYMLTDNGIRENFSRANSILELNAIIRDHIKNGDIIPVSLKKNPSGDVSIKYANFSKENKSTYEIGQPTYSYGKRGFFKSKDIYLNFVSGEIQFRGFNPVDFQGEIRGKYAAHGKIGSSAIVNIVKKNTGHQLYTPAKVASLYKSKDKQFYKDFYTYYKTLDKTHLSFEKFLSELSTKDLGWHVSKFLGMQLLYYIHNSHKNTLDAIIGAMIGYAASESDMSAPFVKVS
jgi:hypothetical protein